MLESCKVTVDGIADNVEILDARVSALELDNSGDVGQGAAIIEDISEIKTIADANSIVLNSLKTSVDTNSTSVTAVKTDVAAVKTAVAGVQNTATSTNNTVGTINTNVNTANTTLANLSNRMANLEAAVAGINTTVSSNLTLKSVTKTYSLTHTTSKVATGLTQEQLTGLYSTYAKRTDSNGTTLYSLCSCVSAGDGVVAIGPGLNLIRTTSSYAVGDAVCQSVTANLSFTYTITFYYFG